MTEYSTPLSIPITVSNFLDPALVSAEFVYNFYVPNEEKEYSPGRRSPIDYESGLVTQDTIQSIEARSRGSLAARVPRYVRISITPKNTENQWDTRPVLTPELLSKIKNTDGTANIRNINLEGEIQNRYVASPVVVDSAVKNRLQREVYSSSESLLRDGGIFGSMSDETISKELNKSLSDEVDESIILDAISDTEIKGYRFSNELPSGRYSKIDIRSEIQHKTSYYADAFRKITSPVCLGNPFSQYFEVDSLGSSAPSAGLSRNSLLDERSFPAFGVSDSDSNKNPEIVWLTQSRDVMTPARFNEFSKNYPAINHTGYIVEKFSVSPSGRYETHPALILTSRTSTEVIDPNIKYGHTYFYKVRQLYLVDIIQITRLTFTEVRYIVATCAVASNSAPVSRVLARESNIPNPPSVLVAEYIHTHPGLRLEWAFPSNPSRDIKKYQVFRRKNLLSPFEIIAEYDFTDEGYTEFRGSETIDPGLVKRSKYPVCYHIDREFDSNSSFIYCIASIDAHGLSSNYGTQIQVSFLRHKNDITSRVISQSGAPKAYPNYYIDHTELDEFGSDRLVEDAIKDSGHGKIRIYFNPDAYKVQSDSVSTPETTPIVISREMGSYKMQIINLDRQISKTLTIDVRVDPSLSGLL